MMSHATSSSNIRTAWKREREMRRIFNTIYTHALRIRSAALHCVTCSKGTLLANSLIRSLALMMAYGSNVFLVVHTEMLPSIRSRETLMCWQGERWKKKQQVTQDREQKQTEMLHSARRIQMDVLLLLRLSPPAASIPSGRLLCTWGRGWRSCFPPADHGGCPLDWIGAPSSHQGQSGGQSRPLRVQNTVGFNTSINAKTDIPTQAGVPANDVLECQLLCLLVGEGDTTNLTLQIFIDIFWIVLNDSLLNLYIC